jgi:hypothetical protein
VARCGLMRVRVSRLVDARSSHRRQMPVYWGQPSRPLLIRAPDCIESRLRLYVSPVFRRSHTDVPAGRGTCIRRVLRVTVCGVHCAGCPRIDIISEFNHAPVFLSFDKWSEVLLEVEQELPPRRHDEANREQPVHTEGYGRGFRMTDWNFSRSRALNHVGKVRAHSGTGAGQSRKPRRRGEIRAWSTSPGCRAPSSCR